jgi:ribonuclease J
MVDIRPDSVKMTDEVVPSSYVMVDGLGVGDVGEVVLRDRRLLAQEGMIVIIATIGRKDGRLIKNPDIIPAVLSTLRKTKDSRRYKG